MINMKKSMDVTLIVKKYSMNRTHLPPAVFVAEVLCCFPPPNKFIENVSEY